MQYNYSNVHGQSSEAIFIEPQVCTNRVLEMAHLTVFFSNFVQYYKDDNCERHYQRLCKLVLLVKIR